MFCGEISLPPPPHHHWAICHLWLLSVLQNIPYATEALETYLWSLKQAPNRQSSSKWVVQIDSNWMSSRTLTLTSPVCWYPPSCGVSPSHLLASELQRSTPETLTLHKLCLIMFQKLRLSFDQIYKHETTWTSDWDHAGRSILKLAGRIKDTLINMGAYWTLVLDVIKINCIHYVISSVTVLSCGLNDVFHYILRKYTQ